MGEPPHLLLITGAPGSGKTRLAGALKNTLKQRLEVACCAKDEFKETLFEVLGVGDAVWSRRLSDASFALMFRMAPLLLLPGRLVLLEGNFRRGEHEPAVRGVLQQCQARLAQVLCAASQETRRLRLQRRAGDPGRHAGHRDQTIDVGNASGGSFLELPGPRLRFDSDRPWENEFTLLLQELKNWYASIYEV